MVGVGETVDVLERVGEGNCDGGRCGGQESTKDSGELHGEFVGRLGMSTTDGGVCVKAGGR